MYLKCNGNLLQFLASHNLKEQLPISKLVKARTVYNTQYSTFTHLNINNNSISEVCLRHH